MATVSINLTSQNTASREVLNLRGQMLKLNEQIASNNRLASEADQATRTRIRGSNQRIRAEQGLLRVQSQRQSLALANLRQEARELGFTSRATRRFTDVTRGLGIELGALGLASVVRELGRFTTDSVRAATRIEGVTRGFQSLGLSASQATQRIEELRQLARLPGIEFQQASQAAIRLRVIGIEGERANSVIRELGNALAITGDTDLTGAIRAITQIVQLGRVNQEEINQLVERSGAASAALQDAFGTTRAEAIQASLEASGQSVQDFVDLLTNSLSKQARVSVDSASNSFQNLKNATFELQAAIGDRLLPTLTNASRGFTEFLSNLTDLVEGTNDAERSLNTYTSTLRESTTAGNVNTAISDRITFLQQEKTALDEAAEGRANYFRFRGQETDAGRQYREITEELARLTSAQNDTASASAYFGTVQSGLVSDARALTQEIARLGVELDGRTGKSVQGITRQLREKRDALAEVQTRLGDNQRVLNALASVNTIVETSTEATTESIQDQVAELIAHSQAAREARNNLSNLSEAQGVLNDFWRVASGQVQDYSLSIEQANLSVVNLVEAQSAFNAAVQANINLIGIAVDGETQKRTALDAAREAYQSATVATRAYEMSILNTAAAASESAARIAEVQRAISGADPSRAEAGLRDFDDAFALSDASMPISRTTSAIREFAGTLPDATRGIRDTTLELQEMSQASLQAARDTAALQASLASIDAFNPETPGRNPNSQNVGRIFSSVVQVATLIPGLNVPAEALSLLGLFRNLQIFHNPISDRVAAGGGRSAARFIQSDLSNQVRNSRDFTNAFVPDFFREFSRLGIAAGATASGGGTSSQPREPIVVQLQLNHRTLQEITTELDGMEAQGRITRTRQRRSLIGKENRNRY